MTQSGSATANNTMDGVALVTGGASGIGAATARKFLLSGVTRLTIADTNEPLLTAFAKQLTTEFPNVEVLPQVTNVSDDASVQAMVDATVAKFGRIDYCANCAGVGGNQPFHEYTTEDWNRVCGVNQNGVFFCLRSQISQMRKQDPIAHPGNLRGERRGAIVSIASVAGFRALQNNAAYTASKHAVNGLTKVAAVENGPFGIRVNAVAPGIIDTPLVAVGPRTLLTVASQPHMTPLSRCGQPEEVAAVIVFLCSDEASFVSGSTWAVDGAMMAK